MSIDDITKEIYKSDYTGKTLEFTLGDKSIVSHSLGFSLGNNDFDQVRFLIDKGDENLNVPFQYFNDQCGKKKITPLGMVLLKNSPDLLDHLITKKLICMINFMVLLRTDLVIFLGWMEQEKWQCLRLGLLFFHKI